MVAQNAPHCLISENSQIVCYWSMLVVCYLFLNFLIIKHKAMDEQNKIILLSKFFAKDRIQGDSLLEKLFELDDIWSKVYEENRIKFSFSVAKEMANEKILLHVLSEKY